MGALRQALELAHALLAGNMLYGMTGKEAAPEHAHGTEANRGLA